MKKGFKIVTSFVLSLLVIFAVIPNLGLKASASVSIGTTWYVGDTVDTGDAWFIVDEWHALSKLKNTKVPEPKLDKYEGISYWRFYNVPIDAVSVMFVGTEDLQPIGFTTVSGSGTESDPFLLKFVYDKKPDSASVSTDWLDPLRTQLAIAADPAIGKNINNTVEFTGDFALPAETMQFLKDHPEVNLKYTFDYKGETHTVVIPGKSVVIEEGVPWYGFENLLGRYGK